MNGRPSPLIAVLVFLLAASAVGAVGHSAGAAEPAGTVAEDVLNSGDFPFGYFVGVVDGQLVPDSYANLGAGSCLDPLGWTGASWYMLTPNDTSASPYRQGNASYGGCPTSIAYITNPSLGNTVLSDSSGPLPPLAPAWIAGLPAAKIHSAGSADGMMMVTNLPATAANPADRIYVDFFYKCSRSDATIRVSVETGNSDGIPFGGTSCTGDWQYWQASVPSTGTRSFTNLRIVSANGSVDFLIKAVRMAIGVPLPPLSRVDLLHERGCGAGIDAVKTANDDGQVNSLTGGFCDSGTDLGISSGVGVPFSYARSYSSDDADYSGRLGPVWRDNLSTYLELLAGGDVAVHSSGGQIVGFALQGDGSFKGSARGVRSRLSATQNGFELVRQDQSKLVFDAQGRLVSMLDRHGRGLTLAYAQGELTSVTDFEGRQALFAYNPQGLLASVSTAAPDTRSVSYGYDAQGRLQTVTDVRGKTWTYSYDAISGKLSQLEDPNGHFRYRVTYNATSGKASDVLDARGKATGYAWSTQAGKTTATRTDAAGKEWKSLYNPDGYLTDAIDPLGAKTSYAYDTDSNLVRVTDPRGGITKSVFDTNGNRLSLTKPLAVSESWTYNATNDLTSHTDARGNLTSYSYNPNGTLASVSGPLGSFESYAYDNLDRLIGKSDAVQEPGASQRLVTTSYSYDSLSQLKSTTSPLGNETSYEYDDAGRVVSVVEPRGNVAGCACAGRYTTSFTYDAAGHKLSEADALGNQTTYVYDDVGNLSTLTNELEQSWTYAYNAADERVNEIAPGNRQSSVSYNDRGQVETSSSTGAGTTSFSYDAAGRLATRTDPRGNEAGADPADYRWAYSYDANDNLLQTRGPAGFTQLFEYDALGRRVLESTYDTSSSYAQQTQTLSPIGYWRLGEASGSTTTDSSGHGRTGSYAGAPTLGQLGAVPADTAVKFNGSGQYALVNYNAALNPAVFTVAAWAYVTGGQNTQRGLVSSRDNWINERGYELRASSGNKWQFAIADGSYTLATLTGPALALNHWTFVVGSYDGSVARLYVDGVLKASATVTYGANSNRPFRIAVGEGSRSLADFFPGAVDEVALFPSAITQTQINNLYSARGVRETSTSYDANDNVTQTIGPLGQKRSFSYDALDRLQTQTVGEPAQSTVIDGFNRANEDPLGNGAWTVTDGVSAAARLVSNEAAGKNTGSLSGSRTIASYTADSRAQATVKALPGSDGRYFRLYVRWSGSTKNGYFAQVDKAGAQMNFRVFRSSGGTATELGVAVAHSVAVGDTLGFSAQGSTIRAWYRPANGTIWEVVRSQTDSTYAAAGFLGLGFGDTTGRLDDFGGGVGGDFNNLPPAPLGITTSYGYDAAGRRIKVTSQGGSISSSSYDDDGRLTSTVDPRGNVTGANPDDYRSSFAYDAAGNLLTATNPLGKVTSFGYDELGQRTSQTDALQHTTAWAYDELGRLTSVTAPDQTITPYGYDPVTGDLATRTDAKQHTTSYGYDPAGRLASIGTPLGKQWTYAYDVAGNKIAKVNANGNATPDPNDGKTSFAYDKLNRLTGIDYSDSTPDVGFAYNGFGERTQMTDGDGTESYAYDSAGQLTTVTRGASTIGYGYDAIGELTSRSYPDGTSVAYGYDTDGQLSSVTSAGQTTSYAYDAAGNLAQTTLPAANGYVESNTFDHAGRLSQVKNVRAGVLLSEYDVTRDDAGQSTRVDRSGSVGASSESYQYDPLGRISEACFQTSACSQAGDPFVRWSYDAVGNRLSEERPGQTTSSSYDADDRLSQSVASAPGANPYSGQVQTDGAQPYYRFGEASGASFASTVGSYPGTWTGAPTLGIPGALNADVNTAVTLNGTSQYGSVADANQLDKTNNFTLETWVKRTKNATLQAVVGKPLTATTKSENYAFWFDTANKIRFEVGAGNKSATVTSAAALDTGWHHVVGTFASGVLKIYVDGALSSSATAVGFTTATANTGQLQLGRAGTANYYGGSLDELALYDSALSATQVTDHYNKGTQLPPPAQTTTNYSYDDNGQLLSNGSRSFAWNQAGQVASSSAGTSSVAYAYDGLGKRLSATVGTNVTNYLWDPSFGLPQLVRESDGASATVRGYLYGAAGAISVTTPTGTSYLDHDADGSVAAVTDAAGTLERSRAYEPFGMVRSETAIPAAPLVPLGYSGQYQDPTTQLYHLRARDYDPALGRMLSSDPLAPAITDPYVSAYVYSGDMPTMFSDPSGLCICPGERASNAWNSATSGVSSGVHAIGSGISSGVHAIGSIRGQVGQGLSLLGEITGVNDAVSCARNFGANAACGMTAATIGMMLIPGGALAREGIGLVRMEVSSGRMLRELAAHDAYSAWHSQNVGNYSRMIAKEMGAGWLTQREAYLAGLTHDIGKTRVGSGLLNYGEAAEEGGAAFRYVTEGEVKVAERTGRVPNIDRLGNPKSVFYSTDRYGSAAEAEKALQLGRHNPTGATASPTHVIMASSRGANWSYGGNVEGGTGVELITENPLDVLGIWRLGP